MSQRRQCCGTSGDEPHEPFCDVGTYPVELMRRNQHDRLVYALDGLLQATAGTDSPEVAAWRANAVLLLDEVRGPKAGAG